MALPEVVSSAERRRDPSDPSAQRKEARGLGLAPREGACPPRRSLDLRQLVGRMLTARVDR
jgi:hypothetical protein